MGRGKQYGTFTPVIEYGEAEHKPIQVWTGDYFYFMFGDLKNRPPFIDEHKRLELLRRLNDISGITISNKAIDKYPTIALTTLNDQTALEQFLEVLDWTVQEIRTTS